MKSKLLLAVTAALAIGSTSLVAGPGPRDPASRTVAPRQLSSPVPEMKCETMSIKAGGKDAGTRLVACKDYAKIRPDDCRRACANK